MGQVADAGRTLVGDMGAPMSLINIEAGDRVAVFRGWNRTPSVATVERATKLHVIVDGMKFRKDGYLAGKRDRWSMHVRAEPLTSEMSAFIAKESARVEVVALFDTARERLVTASAHLDLTDLAAALRAFVDATGAKR